METEEIEAAADGDEYTAWRPGSRWIYILAGRGKGKTIGCVNNRQLHRVQKPNYWFTTAERVTYLTMDSETYHANVGHWDMLVAQEAEELYIIPTSLARMVGTEIMTPYGRQFGIPADAFFCRSAVRQSTIFDFIPESQWGTRRAAMQYEINSPGAPTRMSKGMEATSLTEEFIVYNAAHPDRLLEYITVASFVADMQWGKPEMKALLDMIAVNNNYRSRYKRMIVNIDSELASLVMIGDFETQ